MHTEIDPALHPAAACFTDSGPRPKRCKTKLSGWHPPTDTSDADAIESPPVSRARVGVMPIPWAGYTRENWCRRTHCCLILPQVTAHPPLTPDNSPVTSRDERGPGWPRCVIRRRIQEFCRTDHLCCHIYLVVGVDVDCLRVAFDCFLPLARLEGFVAWKARNQSKGCRR